MYNSVINKFAMCDAKVIPKKNMTRLEGHVFISQHYQVATVGPLSKALNP